MSRELAFLVVIITLITQLIVFVTLRKSVTRKFNRSQVCKTAVILFLITTAPAGITICVQQFFSPSAATVFAKHFGSLPTENVKRLRAFETQDRIATFSQYLEFETDSETLGKIFDEKFDLISPSRFEQIEFNENRSAFLYDSRVKFYQRKREDLEGWVYPDYLVIMYNEKEGKVLLHHWRNYLTRKSWCAACR